MYRILLSIVGLWSVSMVYGLVAEYYLAANFVLSSLGAIFLLLGFVAPILATILDKQDRWRIELPGIVFVLSSGGLIATSIFPYIGYGWLLVACIVSLGALHFQGLVRNQARKS